MKDAALNRLIAEALGYTNVEYNYDRAYHTCDIGELGYHWLVGEKFGADEILPNYCQDLNAMHEVEKTLDCKKNTIPDDAGFCSEEDAFIGELEWIVADTCAEESIYKRTISATARQRAEAFAKVKGLIP